MVISHLTVLKVLTISTIGFGVVCVFTLPVNYVESASPRTPPVGCDLDSVTIADLTKADRSCILYIIDYLQGVIAGDTDPRDGGDKQDAEKAINNAITAFERAEEKIDKARDAGRDIRRSVRQLEGAADHIDKAIEAYNDRDYDEAYEAAETAIDMIETALDVIGSRGGHDLASGSNERQQAERSINEVIADFRAAEDKIKAAHRQERDVEEAVESLEYAADLIDDAIESYNERDYEAAIDFAEEADRMIEDALQEIGSRGRDDRENDWDTDKDRDRDRPQEHDRARTKEVLIEGWTELKELREEIRDMEYYHGREYTEEAVSLYEEAKAILYEAQDAYDDRQYGQVPELVDEAEALIEEAYDAL